MKTLTKITQKMIALLLFAMVLLTGVSNAQEIAPPPSEDPADLTNLPLVLNMDTDEINWEEDYTFFPFEGAALERIPNPDATGLNESEYVMQYIKTDGAQPWGGFFYHTADTIEITDDSVFKLKVWSHTDGIQAMLKLEMREFPDVNTGDMFVDIPVANEWVELEWDLSGVDRDTPWDRVVIIMDLDVDTNPDGSDRFTWFLDDFTFESEQATSNEFIDSEVPQNVTLKQNYPNPFNPTTTIDFALPSSSHAVLEVYNMLGQKVATLVNGRLASGWHSVDFDATNLSSGAYIYRLQTGNSVEIRHLTLIK